MTRIERFDHTTASFVSADDLTVIGWDELLGTNWWEVPESANLFLQATIYDIPETVIAALRNLKKISQNSRAIVFNPPRGLRTIVEADTGVGLIINATNKPNETIGDSLKDWQRKATRFGIDAGCVGALVTADCVDIAQGFPDSEFYTIPDLGLHE